MRCCARCIFTIRMHAVRHTVRKRNKKESERGSDAFSLYSHFCTRSRHVKNDGIFPPLQAVRFIRVSGMYVWASADMVLHTHHTTIECIALRTFVRFHYTIPPIQPYTRLCSFAMGTTETATQQQQRWKGARTRSTVATTWHFGTSEENKIGIPSTDLTQLTSSSWKVNTLSTRHTVRYGVQTRHKKHVAIARLGSRNKLKSVFSGEFDTYRTVNCNYFWLFSFSSSALTSLRCRGKAFAFDFRSDFSLWLGKPAACSIFPKTDLLNCLIVQYVKQLAFVTRNESTTNHRTNDFHLLIASTIPFTSITPHKIRTSACNIASLNSIREVSLIFLWRVSWRRSARNYALILVAIRTRNYRTSRVLKGRPQSLRIAPDLTQNRSIEPRLTIRPQWQWTFARIGFCIAIRHGHKFEFGQ